jgi:hypothetical protein
MQRRFHIPPIDPVLVLGVFPPLAPPRAPPLLGVDLPADLPPVLGRPPRDICFVRAIVPVDPSVQLRSSLRLQDTNHARGCAHSNSRPNAAQASRIVECDARGVDVAFQVVSQADGRNQCVSGSLIAAASDCVDNAGVDVGSGNRQEWCLRLHSSFGESVWAHVLIAPATQEWLLPASCANGKPRAWGRPFPR